MTDLISRQAAIDAITDEHIVTNMDSVYDSVLHRCKRATHRILANLPTIDPVKHGKWIRDGGETCALYKCSACNDLCAVAGWANCIPEKQMYKAFKFCPNCGAMMDKGENDATD